LLFVKAVLAVLVDITTNQAQIVHRFQLSAELNCVTLFQSRKTDSVND
jgi:hypothetical protein